MRQTEFALGKALFRRHRRNLLAQLAIRSKVPVHVKLKILRRASRSRRDVRRIRIRSLHIKTTYFNLNIFSTEEALRNFRFRPKDIPVIADAMDWTTGKTKRNRYKCDPVTACFIVLRKLASACRWTDLEYTFGMRSSALSEVFWEVIESFVESKGHLICTLRESLLVERAALYADAIIAKGAPLDSCVGFIDCTKIRMTRPGGHGSLQRACYSGHKRMHCLIYQTVTTPDGLIFYLYGPEVGRRHDTTLLRKSGLEERLQAILLIDGRQFYLYGDAAYMIRPWLQTAFPRVGATEEQLEYDTGTSAVRVSVEWNYKDVKQMWTINDFSRALKVRKSPIALLYISSALLWNMKICIEQGGQLVSFYNIAPPTLRRYLNMESDG